MRKRFGPNEPTQTGPSMLPSDADGAKIVAVCFDQANYRWGDLARIVVVTIYSTASSRR